MPTQDTNTGGILSINTRITNKSDTSTNWTNENPTLLKGEIGYETDTKKLKIGDGTTAWNSLNYFSNESILYGGEKSLSQINSDTSLRIENVLYKVTSKGPVIDYLYNDNNPSYTGTYNISTENNKTTYSIVYSAADYITPANHDKMNKFIGVCSKNVTIGIKYSYTQSSGSSIDLTANVICSDRNGPTIYLTDKIKPMMSEVESGTPVKITYVYKTFINVEENDYIMWDGSTWISFLASADSIDIIDTLVSANPTAALSANQGRVLNEKISTLTSSLDNMSSTFYTKEDIDNGYTPYPIWETGKRYKNGSIVWDTTLTKGTEIITGLDISGYSLYKCTIPNDIPDSDLDLNVPPVSSSSDWEQVVFTSAYVSKYAKNDVEGNQIDKTYATKTELDNKVDKVEGKGLSTNDYTNDAKNIISKLQVDDNGVLEVKNDSVNSGEFKAGYAEFESLVVNGADNIQLSNNASDTLDVELERINKIKYYGDPNIIPDAEIYFNTVAEDDTMISGLTTNGKTLTDIVIPYSINNKIITTIADAAFSNNTNIKTVVLPNSITNISMAAFSGCTSLTSINIPKNINTISSHLFSGCTSLTSIDIPTSITGIGTNAFNNCTSLTSINIPNSVTYMDSSAFNGCTNLKTAYCEQGSYADTYFTNNYPNINIIYTDIKKTELDNKIDKVEGKGLSSNDYTNDAKAEVAKIINKVNYTDFADYSIPGVVSVASSDSGINLNNTNGYLSINAATESDITSRASNYKPIVPSNLNNAVKAALTDKSRITDMDDIDKSIARSVIGAAGITDYAQDIIPGVVKVPLDSGIKVETDGSIYINMADNSDISARTESYKPITPSNLNYAVKAALSDSNRINSMTDDEKINARNVIGAVGVTDLQSAIANKADKSDIDTKLSTVYKIKGSLDPTTETAGSINEWSIGMPSNGDVYNILKDGMIANTITNPEGLTATSCGYYIDTAGVESYYFIEFSQKPDLQVGDKLQVTYDNTIETYSMTIEIYKITPNENQIRFNIIEDDDAFDGEMCSIVSIDKLIRDSISVKKGDNIVWVDGFGWDKLAADIDLSNYVTNTSDKLLTDTQKTVLSKLQVNDNGVLEVKNDGEFKAGYVEFEGLKVNGADNIQLSNNASDTLDVELEKFNKIKYYGDPNIEITPEIYFTVDDSYINGLTTNGKTLTDIVIPYSINGKMISGFSSDAFENNTKLKTVVIPNSIGYINAYVFAGCTSLTSINIPTDSTALLGGTFSGCTSLTNINIPNNVKEIYPGSFNNCTSLTSIVIPDSVTKIYFSTFMDCTSLTSVTIPKSVTEISAVEIGMSANNNAFSGCTNLKTVYCEQGSEAEKYFNSTDFPNVNIIYTDISKSELHGDITTNSVTIGSGDFRNIFTSNNISLQDRLDDMDRLPYNKYMLTRLTSSNYNNINYIKGQIYDVSEDISYSKSIDISDAYGIGCVQFGQSNPIVFRDTDQLLADYFEDFIEPGVILTVKSETDNVTSKYVIQSIIETDTYYDIHCSVYSKYPDGLSPKLPSSLESNYEVMFTSIEVPETVFKAGQRVICTGEKLKLYMDNYSSLQDELDKKADKTDLTNLTPDSIQVSSFTKIKTTSNTTLQASLDNKAAAKHTHSAYDTVFTSTGNNSGTLTPLPATMTQSFRNVTMFTPANAINVEYTTDGGTTWIEYPLSDMYKRQLFIGKPQYYVKLGGPNITTSTITNQCMVRITVSPTDRYTNANMFYCWFNTGGAADCKCTIEASTIGAKDTFTTLSSDIPVAGWSGPNTIMFPGGTYGGNASQTSQKYSYRFTFKTGDPKNKIPQVADLRMYGYTIWNSGGIKMLQTGHMYDWDYAQNLTFPANIVTTDGTIQGKVIEGESFGTQLQEQVKSLASKTPVVTTLPTTALAANTIYDVGVQTSMSLTLPSTGTVGDFIQVDFLSLNTPTTLGIASSAGISDFSLVPTANTIYSLYFDWGSLYYNSSTQKCVYGWRFSYNEYTHTV